MDTEDSDEDPDVAIQFEEDGEIVEMEANDGRAAAEIFKSDDEEDKEISTEEYSESKDEDGINQSSQNENRETDPDGESTGVDEISDIESEVDNTPKKCKTMAKGKKKLSVENRLEQLTSSVQMMQEIIMNQHEAANNSQRKRSKKEKEIGEKFVQNR